MSSDQHIDIVADVSTHSISNISDVIRNHIHRDSLGSLGRHRGLSPSTVHLPLKNAHFESVTLAVVHLFQKKKLQENELATLQESVRTLLTTDAGPLIYDYYKDKLIKKGMIILRETMKHDTGQVLLDKLSAQWDYFYGEILPVLQSLLHPIKAKTMTIRHVALLEFRNTVLLKVPVSDALNSIPGKSAIPPAVHQMLLVLQSVHERPITENTMLLESLVARVVSPYLGMLGLYNGEPEPEIRSNFKIPSRIPTPVIYVHESESDDDSHETTPYDHHRVKRHNLSPLNTSHRLHNKRGSGLLHHPLLAAVKEQERGQIRRYSIATS